MSAVIKGAALALAAGLVASPAYAIDPFFPSFGNDGINVVHYDLALDVKPATGRVDAKAALSIVPQAHLTSFSLDLHALTVSKATLNGWPVDFTQANDKLTITPRRALLRGFPVRLEVTYGGVPDAIPDPTAPGADLFLGWFRYQRAAYVVSEPVGASTFFPANDEPTDKATFAIDVTVPDGYTASANGELRSVARVGTSKRFHWVMDEPMTTWLATVHVNRFTLSTGQAIDGTPVRVYSTPATPPADVNGYLLAGRMIGYFSRLIGRYPFDSYGSVVVDDPILYYALETQTMTTFPLGAADEAVVAHELVHSWFGNSVSVAQWADLWIAEGGATYFEILWPNRNDPAGFDAEMRQMHADAVADGLGPAVVESPEEMFTDRTYVRGALTLYALRLSVGDWTFYKTLKTFTERYRGRNASSADFIRTAVEVSGRRAVGDLLRKWLYEQAVPPLPGAAARLAPRPKDKRPVLVGQRCGRGSHHGSDARCKTKTAAAQ